jgi:plasmid stabilization system protein ParE
VGAGKGAELLLTRRALRDIAEIEAYSVSQWGKPVADRYVADIEAALARLRDKPDLLRARDDLPRHLRFYSVNKHVLVCDVRPRAVCVLTVIHGSRDIPSRLGELQPTLEAEVKLLHARIGRGRIGKK